MKNRYYSLVMDKDKKEATINIFGDITSYAFEEFGEISAANLSKQLEELQDAKTINVHISSYGGEVKEGLAIYNALKNHKAKIKTYCDGFACSIASVIFMAGDERIMSKASLLMIHNAWTLAQGNADELRKQADDLDKITSASINAYLDKVNISENQLKKLMDNETWLTYEEALEIGFATKVENETNSKVSQNVKHKLIDLILQHQEEIDIDDEDIEETKQEGGEAMKYECSECGYIHEGELPEYFVCPECGADKEKFEEVEETETDEEITEELEDEETSDENPEKEEPVEETDEEEPTGEEGEENPEKDNKDDEEVTQKAVAFFSAISRM